MVKIMFNRKAQVKDSSSILPQLSKINGKHTAIITTRITSSLLSSSTFNIRKESNVYLP